MSEAAERIGIGVEELRRLVELGHHHSGRDGRFSSGDMRMGVARQSLVAAGVPLDGLGAAIRSGRVSLAFLDAPAFERFSALSGVTFAQFAARSGVPVQLLMLIREAAGSAGAAAGRHHPR